MATTGKLELTIKINELLQVKTVEPPARSGGKNTPSIRKEVSLTSTESNVYSDARSGGWDISSNRIVGDFTQLTTAKDGSICEYPTIDKERDPEAIGDWYWHYTYKLKNPEGKFVTHTETVPRRKVPTVRDLIAQNTSVAGILEYLHSSS